MRRCSTNHFTIKRRCSCKASKSSVSGTSNLSWLKVWCDERYVREERNRLMRSESKFWMGTLRSTSTWHKETPWFPKMTPVIHGLRDLGYPTLKKSHSTWCACKRHAKLLHSSSRAGSCCADSSSSSNHRSNHGRTWVRTTAGKDGKKMMRLLRSSSSDQLAKVFWHQLKTHLETFLRKFSEDSEGKPFCLPRSLSFKGASKKPHVHDAVLPAHEELLSGAAMPVPPGPPRGPSAVPPQIPPAQPSAQRKGWQGPSRRSPKWLNSRWAPSAFLLRSESGQGHGRARSRFDWTGRPPSVPPRQWLGTYSGIFCISSGYSSFPGSSIVACKIFCRVPCRRQLLRSWVVKKLKSKGWRK